MVVESRLLFWAKVGWAVFPAGLVVWLVVVDLSPRGQLVVRSAWEHVGPYLGRPVPESRVSGPWGNPPSSFFRLHGEPIYLDVRQPRPFTRLQVQVRFDPGSSAVVELGLAHNRQAQAVELMPLYHRGLEAVVRQPGWTVVEGQGLRLYQRGAVFPTVAAFLRQPPVAALIATYRVPSGLALPAAPLPVRGPSPDARFVLTSYHPPAVADDWRVATVTFPLTAVHAAQDKLRLVLSFPERDLGDPPPRISSVVVTLQGNSLKAQVLSGWLARWFRPRI